MIDVANTMETIDRSMSVCAMNDEAVSFPIVDYALPSFARPPARGAMNNRGRMLQLGSEYAHSPESRDWNARKFGDPTLLNDWIDAWWREFVQKSDRDLVEQQYAKQIALLMNEAQDEAIDIDDGSLSGFWSFVEIFPLACIGDVFMTNSGDISVEWRTGQENHFELRFLGENRVNYLFFKKRPGETRVSTGYGTEPLSRILDLANSSGFGPLIFS